MKWCIWIMSSGFPLCTGKTQRKRERRNLCMITLTLCGLNFLASDTCLFCQHWRSFQCLSKKVNHINFIFLYFLIFFGRIIILLSKWLMICAVIINYESEMRQNQWGCCWKAVTHFMKKKFCIWFFYPIGHKAKDCKKTSAKFSYCPAHLAYIYFL